MADLTLGIKATDGASDVFKKIGKAALEFSKDSVRAFMEQERADAKLSSALKQLGYDAKILTETFKSQADALEGTLGVSNEVVQAMQSLMLRYGTAPRDIKSTTEAILDYAAATGTDAESATLQLLKAVEGGGKGLSKLGIDIQQTGDKSKDLSLAVEALAEKFGGAATANAETLGGQLAILGAKFEGVQKSWGGFIALVERKLGVVEKAGNIIDEWTTALGGGEAAIQKGIKERNEEKDAVVESLGKLYAQRNAVERDIANAQLFGDEAKEEQAQRKVVRLQNEINALEAKRDELEGKRQAAGNAREGRTDVGRSKTAEQMAAEERAERAKEAEKKVAEERAKVLREQREKEVATTEKNLEEDEILAQDGVEIRRRALAEERDLTLSWYSEEEEMQDEHARLMREQRREDLAQTEAEYARAGATIGAAMIGALAAEIRRMREGGDADLGAMMRGILPVLGTVIGGLAGGPLGAQLGGAGGGLLGAFFHDGGYVGELPRHHSGSWIAPDEQAAILQKGERVVSRAEIAGLGGPRGAEQAIRGGGSTVIHVSTFDSASFRDTMSGRGGRAFAESVRYGRGELAAMVNRIKKGRK